MGSEAAAPPYPPHWYRPAGYSQAAPVANNPSLAHAAAAAAAAAAAYMPSLVGASFSCKAVAMMANYCIAKPFYFKSSKDLQGMLF